MRYLIIFIILSFCGALVYMRLRPYIAVVRRALGFIRATRQLNRTTGKLLWGMSPDRAAVALFLIPLTAALAQGTAPNSTPS